MSALAYQIEPEMFGGAFSGVERWSPEKELIAMILYVGCRDAMHPGWIHTGESRPATRHIQRSAIAWMASCSDAPGSFVWCVEALHGDRAEAMIDYIRRRVWKELKSGSTQRKKKYWRGDKKTI